MSVVNLDDYIRARPTVVMPAPYRLRIFRAWGRVEDSQTIIARNGKEYRVVMIEDADKPFAFTGAMARPPIGQAVEVIATEGAVWHFVKWWRPVEESGYTLRPPSPLEEMILEVLAGSPDETVSADDLHTPEIEQWLIINKRDPRAIGAALASLDKQGITKIIGRKRSSRRACHNRPDLKIRTWRR